MTRTLCVVTDRVSESQLRAVDAPRGGEVDLLAFAAAASTTSVVIHWLGSAPVRQLDARALLQSAVPSARERFIRFVAEWPDRVSVFGRPFREAFASGDCSLWWLTELAQKNPGARPTFGRLCQLEAVKIALVSGDYGRIVLVCGDRDTAKVLRHACVSHGVHVDIVAPSQAGGESFTRLFLGRAKRLGLDLAATLMARRLPDGRDVPADERRIAFLTWFPTQWTEWRGVMRDRHYVDLPEAIAKRGNRRPFYACLLPAGSWRHLAGGVRAAAREIAAHEPGAMIFVERFARVRDVLRRYLDLRAALTYWWLERFDAAFRRSFDWDGVDVFPLLRHDLRVSFVRDLPFLELLALRVRNLVRHLQPADLVTTLETYGYGRAVAWGAHTSGLPVRVIGFQHSAVNSNQLVYRFSPAEVGNSPPYVDHMPLPDEYVAYGEHARSMLERSGVSGDRIFICGGPRFDDLTQFRRQRCERFDESRSAFGIAPAERMVLVATVIWPGLTARLLEWCGMAVSRIPGLAIVVKPHPLHKHIEREIVAAFSAVSGRVIVSHGNLNALQAAADVMIGTAGTTDIEAIAIGCPVIRVHTADFDFSPSSDEPGATLDVTSAEELKAAVARVLAGAWRPENTDVLVEKAFYKLDGREIDRVIAALERFDLRATAPA